MAKKRGKLVIISAPSGAGKTTVIKHFLSTHPNMVHSISATTRPTRGCEQQGTYYHHIDEDTFREWVKEGKLAEWAEYCGNLYGTPKEPLDKWLNEGKIVLLDLEVVGGTKLKNLYKDDAISIFIMPPSQEELEKRLKSRATDSKEAQDRRLKTALFELGYKDKYDYRVINDVLERACKEIEKIIKNKMGN